MKTIKQKYLSIILALLLALSSVFPLSACSSEPQEVEPTPEPTKVVHVSIPTPSPKPTPEPTPEPNPVVESQIYYATTPYSGYSLSMTVYVSNRGGKIHTSPNCSGMKYYSVMSYGQACQYGYSHCMNCF